MASSKTKASQPIPDVFQPDPETDNSAVALLDQPPAEAVAEPAAELPADALPPVKPCSKCGGELNTTGNPQWCKSCQAAYRREYNTLRLRRAEVGGFTAGAEAMRKKLALSFRKMPPLFKIGPRGAAELIEGCPPPEVPAPADTEKFADEA